MRSDDDARRVSRLLTYAQAAERLGISEAAFRKRVWAGKIPRVRLGPRTCRIDEDELEEYIERGRQGSRWFRAPRDKGEGG